MRLLPSDPDVETIISRIEAKDLNLQPEFQRGEVWSRAKKQRLVDSILRDWHVPPIHVIEAASTRRQEVLDGQQRLVAIRDFARNEFAVDGSIEPKDPRVEALDGLRYRDLPPEVKRQFNQFTIRVFRIVDFKATEPAELFFRLNQPTNLTSAEQRNAYFGPVREQIKELVELLPSFGLIREFLGFSNARMSYDDVLCRVALCIERGSISERITSADLVELYRSDKPVTAETISRMRRALAELGNAATAVGSDHPRFNKATLFSWILFLVRSASPSLGGPLSATEVAALLSYFASGRGAVAVGVEEGNPEILGLKMDWLFGIYEDRSTSRVLDAASVVLRDLVIWLMLYHILGKPNLRGASSVPPVLQEIVEASAGKGSDELAHVAIEHGWGRLQ